MRIADIMSKHVHCVTADRGRSEALAEMTTRGVHHLVVLDDRAIVGVVSERDLHDPDAQTVGDAMTPHPVTTTPETTIRDAANLMRGRTIGCLPVSDGDTLVGIVTITDLLELIGRGVTKPIEESRRWTLRRRSPKRRPEPTPR